MHVRQGLLSIVSSPRFLIWRPNYFPSKITTILSQKVRYSQTSGSYKIVNSCNVNNYYFLIRNTNELVRVSNQTRQLFCLRSLMLLQLKNKKNSNVRSTKMGFLGKS